MKLNNKGFAITGILYTLFILFSLTLISIITGLNNRKKIMENSIESIENNYNFSTCESLEELTKTNSKGKYFFKIKNTTTYCISYLPENTVIDPTNIIYTTDECNNNKNSLQPIGYCETTVEE